MAICGWVVVDFAGYFLVLVPYLHQFGKVYSSFAMKGKINLTLSRQ
jgi:hypothetical protein